ncbi:MAG: CHAD domain-containing protein [Steroidobacteraceae bacterium]
MSSSARPARKEEPSHKDGREVEWQLASTDLASVRRWLDDHGTIEGLVLEPRSTLKIFDTYFDTDDWRIHRAGFALRIRSEDGKSEATLKSLRSNSTVMADRRELSETLQSTDSESIARSTGPVGMRVHAVSGAHPLQPLFEVHTSRQRYAVHTANDERPLGEIALDETVISRPQGEPQTSLQRVEVEALTDAHEPLQTLVKALQSGCSLEAASDTKFSQGLKSVGLAPVPPAELAPTAVNAAMRIEEVGLANLRLYMSAWDLHEPGARLGDDPEELHDLRLAGRRLDAILRQFGAYLPAALVQIRPTLKTVLRALGEARDLDVALLELDAFNRRLSGADQATLEPLKQHLRSERAGARTRMLTLLDSSTVQKDFNELRLGLAQPSDAIAAPGAPALQVVPGLIRARYKKVRKGAKRLTPESAMESYHAVRANVKKVRYLLESVSGMFGKPAGGMVRSLRRWQEKLGVQQDADVASRRLQSLAAAPPKGLPPETLFLMGRLAAHYADRASKARKRHPRAYRKVRGRWKVLKSKLEEVTPRLPPLPSSGP